jgi:hypothetical protein
MRLEVPPTWEFKPGPGPNPCRPSARLLWWIGGVLPDRLGRILRWKKRFTKQTGYVYRYFKKREYLEAFMEGFIYLSTFVTCRRIEEDPYEAIVVYESGTIMGWGDDPKVRLIAQRLRLDVHPGTWYEISGNVVTYRADDAWLLCTSLCQNRFCKQKFGPFCVEIREPGEFFRLVSSRMQRDYGTSAARIGAVHYRPRRFSGTEPPPGHIAFVKDVKRFYKEDEVRMFWQPAQSGPVLDRVTVRCPEACEFLRDVS